MLLCLSNIGDIMASSFRFVSKYLTYFSFSSKKFVFMMAFVFVFFFFAKIYLLACLLFCVHAWTKAAPETWWIPTFDIASCVNRAASFAASPSNCTWLKSCEYATLGPCISAHRRFGHWFILWTTTVTCLFGPWFKVKLFDYFSFDSFIFLDKYFWYLSHHRYARDDLTPKRHSYRNSRFSRHRHMDRMKQERHTVERERIAERSSSKRFAL